MEKIPGKFNSQDGFRVLLFSTLVLFLFFCTGRHLPWRDEYQTFLVATRTDSFAEFWTAVRYERTPPLHYLILRYLWPIFDGWLDPRAFIRVVTLPFSLLTLWLITFRFRFSLTTVLLLGLNVFLFREWGVLSRSYALGGALLLLSLAFRFIGNRTLARIFILAAACTHLLFFVGCGMILLIEYLSILRSEGLKLFRRWDFWIAGVVGGIILLQQIPPPDSVFATELVWPGTLRLLSRSIRYFAVILFPLEHDWTGSWDWNYVPISMAFGIPALAYVFYLFRENLRLLALFFLSVTPILFIYQFGYSPAVRHYGVLFIFFLYFWIRHREALLRIDPSASRRIAVMEAVAFIGPAIACLVWLKAWNPIAPEIDFSDAPRVAPLMAIAPQTFTSHDFPLFPAMAESHRRVYDLSSGRWASYPFFRKGFAPVDLTEICFGKVPGVTLGNSDLLVIRPDEVASMERVFKLCPGWTPIYKTERRIVTDETFSVFVYEKPVMTADALKAH